MFPKIFKYTIDSYRKHDITIKHRLHFTTFTSYIIIIVVYKQRKYKRFLTTLRRDIGR